MKNFKRGGQSGGYRSDRGSGKRDFGGGGFDRGGNRQMYDAVCGKCGNDCQIPFRPTGNKPVFCSNCFERPSSAGSGKFGGGGFRGDRGDKQMHPAVCTTCGDRCEVPFRPTGDKPIYCSNCFGKSDTGARGKGGDQFKEQFNTLNYKLDKILSILSPGASAKTIREKKKSVSSADKKELAVEKKAPAKKLSSSADKKPAAKKKAKLAVKKVAKKPSSSAGKKK
ncbi:MAG: hypothetical protein COU33_01590 [Candidatus Magasanikbacteria bacterium CG10_big_fil_rev_8_21_14_0_10_43_6]|uniref:CxxC-x17-CxxC domain-containing protein n=1 Tax=Candidatus Magasanikbacteria bacterium CG10_big_fil_rev_8_21_14_0_10_43_6 TaxID=1974650 RepID=A0A2M6W1S2_9BACT|nr:MAG: hypothetical protein COU33_01590 [Candidatus Magasanikbacteria bacterium CG10_big_fil_rev_8_21_14_0_10_43_6]